MRQDSTIPRHIAVIMDGNRRWAKAKGLPVISGHEKVANDILEPLIEHAAKRGIKFMTFWAWSTENWQRDKREVTAIMKLFNHVINRRWQRLHEKGVRVNVIGDISKFAPVIKNGLVKVMEQTRENRQITATFALNYGGRDELLRSFKKLAKEISSGQLTDQISNLNEQSFARFMDTVDLPDPDIIVRPGGEKRLSGFMPWQSVYSELFFMDWMMPEFTAVKLDEILIEFNQRQRRFGK